MSQANPTCPHCGASVSTNAEFCRACGKTITTPAVSIPSTLPGAAAPRPTNYGLVIGLAIVGVIVVCACLATATFVFLYMQNQAAMPVRLPIGTPQVAAAPTFVAPTSLLPPATSAVRPPTFAPTATILPQPSATPTLPPGILFDDDFSSKTASESKGWTFTATSAVARTWLPNQFIVSLKEKQSSDVIFPNGEYEDFGAEVQVQPISGTLGIYALGFRSSGTEGSRSVYSFGIDPQAGEYYLTKVVTGSAHPSPLAMTPSLLINRGMNPNTLGVIVKGSRIELYINRTQVMAIHDDAIKGKGKIGIGVNTEQGPATIALSRFTVYTPEQAFAAWCPPPVSFPAGILFEETFGSQRVAACNDWKSATADYGDFLWSPSRYTISANKPNGGGMNTMEIPGRQYADFALETEAQPLDDNVNAYGLHFRFSRDPNGKNTYYRFLVFPDGRYVLDKFVAGEMLARVVDYTTSPAVKTGKNKNILGVILQGSTISLYTNRTLVKTVTDDTIKGSGYVGVMAHSGTKVPAAVAFSRVTVLSPDKAKAEWGSTSAPAAPPVVAGSSSPEIVALEFPSEIPANNTKYDGLVRFRDAGGDIARISFDPAFAQPPGSTYESFGFEFTNPAVRWVEGNATSTSGAFRFSFACRGETIKVTYAATLYDKAGNKSMPYPFSFVCKSGAANALTVFFTIQNGSPTGYVIDQQGVKHSPPGYLTISDLHVAPGDRIVIQTDQPRFSLLFDCGTSPQTFTPCDFVASTPAGLPAEIRKNSGGTAYLNISRADNWAGTRSNFPSQRYPADPVLRIALGD